MASLETIKNMLEKPNEDEINFYVKNHDHTFEITCLVLKKKLGYLKLDIYYNILPIQKGMRYRCPTQFETTDDIIQYVFHLLWKYKLCNECFNLIKESEESICDDCKPQKYFWEYGMEHKLTNSIPTCSICFEQAYSSKLQCGHYFHLTCFQNLCYETSIRCPVCRVKITKADRINFYLENTE